MSNDRVLLIDGDIIVYKAAFGAEQVHQFDTDTWASTANEEEARAKFEGLIAGLVERLRGDQVCLAISDPDANWRKALLPDYKKQRNNIRRPILLKPLREFAIGLNQVGAVPVKVYQRPTLEADDVLGILATHPTLVQGKKCVCSIDKDLLQIPGFFFNIDKPDEGTQKITEVDGNLRHMMQTLTGDIVDNYKGCPGVGAVKAAKLLVNPQKMVVTTWEDKKEGVSERTTSFVSCSMWEVVVETFKSKGLTEDDALVQAQIARICRNTEYDFTTKRVRPWQPPR